MTIQEKINADLKAAILAKDEAKKSILRVLIGEFSRIPTDATKVVSDDKATSVIKKLVENAKIILSTSGSSNPLFDEIEAEIKILSEYLPKQLSEDELTGLIENLIISTGAASVKEMGKVMGGLKPYAGQYDGKLASEIIKKRLSQP